MPDPETLVTLPNGVRLLQQPGLPGGSATVAVFVRAGSAHEARRVNGIGHVLEHMAFKGTKERDARRINLDAERLGAEVNAHTDKDHTAFHMRGLPQHAGVFVHMLGDLVQHATFPEAELERERQVLLHEFTEDEDDPVSTAYKLLDKASFGAHPAAQPVIGSRRNIERLTRDDLVAHVARLYTGANVVVAVAAAGDPDTLLREVEAAFGGLPPGTPNLIAQAPWHGGIRSRRQAGSSQTHLVLGLPLPALRAGDPVGEVAAALFGEGMSSPLLDAVRERRGLAYFAACSADVLDFSGQFVVEASTSPEQLVELLAEVVELLAAQAEAIAAEDFERAHNQLAVRALRQREKPLRRLEEAALDVFALGRARSAEERAARIAGVGVDELRAAFARMLTRRPALAVTGRVAAGTNERLRDTLARRFAGE